MNDKLNKFCDFVTNRFGGTNKDVLIDDYYENPAGFPLSTIIYFPALLSDDLMFIWEYVGSKNLDDVLDFRDKHFYSFTLREAESAKHLYVYSEDSDSSLDHIES